MKKSKSGSQAPDELYEAASIRASDQTHTRHKADDMTAICVVIEEQLSEQLGVRKGIDIHPAVHPPVALNCRVRFTHHC